MYDPEDIMNQYQSSFAGVRVGVESIDSSQLDEMVLVSPQMDYTTSAPPYNPHNSYISDVPEDPYCSFSVPPLPQAQPWLSTESTALDSTQHIYSIPHTDEVTMSRLPVLRHSLSKSSSDGPASVASEEQHPAKDDVEQKKKDKKERRRAQNRVAQRLFRARREVSLKESSQRLENLEEEVGRLHSRNEGLSETVSRLQEEIQRLRRENISLKRRLSDPVKEDVEVLRISAPSVFLDPDSEPSGDTKLEAATVGEKISNFSDASDLPGPSTPRRRNRKQRTNRANTSDELPSKFL